MDAFCSCAPVPGPGYWLAGLISTAKQKWTCTFHATTSCISAVTQICETFIQGLFFSTVYGMCFPLNPLKPRQEIVCFWYITDNWMFATALKIFFNYNYHSQQVLLLVISSLLLLKQLVKGHQVDLLALRSDDSPDQKTLASLPPHR